MAAVARLGEAAESDPTIVLGFCIEATRGLYARMVEIGDFTSALRAVKQLHELTCRGKL